VQPVFGSVVEAMDKTGADVSVLFVPPAFTRDAIIEAIDAKIGLAVVITEGVPVHDTAYAWAYAVKANQGRAEQTRIIGPNCPGIISPGKSNAGIIPADITGPGRVGLVSKSGTLTYQMMYELRDLGFSTAIGIGGDPVIGTTHIDALAAFETDEETEAIVMIGEIGGDAEERAAAFIADNVTKPVVGYVAGFTAPEGKTMGHAGAIVSGSAGTAQAKKQALEAVGVKVGKTHQKPPDSCAPPPADRQARSCGPFGGPAAGRVPGRRGRSEPLRGAARPAICLTGRARRVRPPGYRSYRTKRLTGGYPKRHPSNHLRHPASGRSPSRRRNSDVIVDAVTPGSGTGEVPAGEATPGEVRTHQLPGAQDGDRAVGLIGTGPSEPARP
jgi:succinyl-CoA synthetase alpha subunit